MIRYGQRVLNYIYRARLSSGCMIRLLVHTFLPPLSSVSSTGEATHRKIEKERQMADERKGMGEKPNHTTARKPGPL